MASNVPANQFEKLFGTHLHPSFLFSGRKVAPKMNLAKLYLDSHLSESDWCGLVLQFGSVYARKSASRNEVGGNGLRVGSTNARTHKPNAPFGSCGPGAGTRGENLIKILGPLLGLSCPFVRRSPETLI